MRENLHLGMPDFSVDYGLEVKFYARERSRADGSPKNSVEGAKPQGRPGSATSGKVSLKIKIFRIKSEKSDLLKSNYFLVR